MRSIIASLLLATIATLSVAAHAAETSYSFVDAGYLTTDIDGISDRADGFLLRGSLEVTDRVFVFAGYSSQSIDGLDVEDYGIGVGYAWPITEGADIYGKAGYVRAEADLAGFSLEDDGYSLGVGIRGRVLDRLELEGAVNYTDLSDLGDDTTLAAAARWYFIEQFAVGVEAVLGEDATSYGIGLRWNFGK